jgi:hypothetical protein
MGRLRSVASALALAGASALLALAFPAGAAAQTPVAVYPSPGTLYNTPQTQIAFRGVPASQLGSIHVVGSISGVHAGHVEADSDGDGGSFLPSQPFVAGETVTVSTSLNILDGKNGTFSFQIAQLSHPIAPATLPVVHAVPGGLQHFHSEPGLIPPSVRISTDSAPASEGDIFVAPQFGPAENGPMILDPRGRLLWFYPSPISKRVLMTDFRVQNFGGSPALTWWQGYTNNGTGEGEGVIFNENYQQVATVQAANGLVMDLHEFLITPQGQAYLIAVEPLSLPNLVHKPTLNAVVQEIDIKTGLVLFQWDALDHVPLSDSHFTTHSPGFVFDPYHANSVGVDRDGNLIVSLRNTSTVYKINRDTGQIMWELGGKQSSFKMAPGTSTAFQHDAVIQPDDSLTIFDDGAGPPRLHPYARGIRVVINMAQRTATLVKQYDHSPRISTNFEGSVQVLPDGNVFLGWGQQPYFSEVNASGQQILDAHFAEPSGSYRAYRFQWNGQPLTPPAIAVSPNGDGSTEVYASWNGATDVNSWRVLAGATPGSLAPVGGASWSGFETGINVRSASPYFAVQAIGPKRTAIGTSVAHATPQHIAIYGRSVFVSQGGVGAVPVGCFLAQACKLSMTVSSGRTVIATTGSEGVGAGKGGLPYFSLTAAGRALLAHARGRRLVVGMTARDRSGISAGSTVTLVPFATSGTGPRRLTSSAGPVQIVGLTDFVSSTGVGGILTSCLQANPCHASATISVGSTVIARAGTEFLGARELGYLIFSLTSAGQSMLAHAAGNQLSAHLAVTSGQGTAAADVALVRFS